MASEKTVALPPELPPFLDFMSTTGGRGVPMAGYRLPNFPLPMSSTNVPVPQLPPQPFWSSAPPAMLQNGSHATSLAQAVRSPSKCPSQETNFPVMSPSFFAQRSSLRTDNSAADHSTPKSSYGDYKINLQRAPDMTSLVSPENGDTVSNGETFKAEQLSEMEPRHNEEKVQKMLNIALANNQRRFERGLDSTVSGGGSGSPVLADQEQNSGEAAPEQDVEPESEMHASSGTGCDKSSSDQPGEFDESRDDSGLLICSAPQHVSSSEDSVVPQTLPEPLAIPLAEPLTTTSSMDVNIPSSEANVTTSLSNSISSPGSDFEDSELLKMDFDEDNDNASETASLHCTADGEQADDMNPYDGDEFHAVTNAEPNKEGLFFCHLCEFTGNNREEFTVHMSTHYEYQCPKCDYKSRTEGRLKRHLKDFHSDIPPENYSGKVTRSGRSKVHRCKQCPFFTEIKYDFWAHSRLHIKDDKILECPKCPFVTEYKHHLEYHIRNHFGSKPFKCSKCNYQCVNKSMLNSHMKSHTNVYQYRCANCTYATKYCHSLKQHLKKYNHKPATILNSDGSLPEYDNSAELLNIKRGPSRCQRVTMMPTLPKPPQNPLSMTPVSGAPGLPPQMALRLPTQSTGPASLPQPGAAPRFFGIPATPPLPWPLLPQGLLQHLPLGAAGVPPAAIPPLPIMQQQMNGSWRCQLCQYQTETREELTAHLAKAHLNKDKPDQLPQHAQQQQQQNVRFPGIDLNLLRGSQQLFPSSLPPLPPPVSAPVSNSEEALDLTSKITAAPTAQLQEQQESPQQRKRPRKNPRASRLDSICRRLKTEQCEEETHAEVLEEMPSEDVHSSSSLSPPVITEENNTEDIKPDITSKEQECTYCRIVFKDSLMFDLHMGYHGYDDPFKCNRCGVQSSDKVDFFIHMMRTAHS